MPYLVLFDLGDTLEQDGRLREGARECLAAAAGLTDDRGEPVALGLGSDYGLASSPRRAARLRSDYLALLERLGIRELFEPVAERVTLSSDVGALEPDRRFFERAARRGLGAGAGLDQLLFVSENREHVGAARRLGIRAVHLRGPDQPAGEADDFGELLELLRGLLRFSPCCKKHADARGKRASAAARSKRLDPAIRDRVDRVTEAGPRATIDGLCAFPTRWTHADAIASVWEWVAARFAEIGFQPGTEVRLQPFPAPGNQTLQNVLAGPARLGGRGLVLVCAHYDSLSETPHQSAPGADDNASGVAVLLEAARVLRGEPLGKDVLFAAFGGEEQGLFGSQCCAEIAADEGWPIELVINLDMVGYSGGATRREIVVEYDQGNVHHGNDAAAKAFGLVMAQAAVDYTSLSVRHTDIWNSDYMPFEARGFPCVGAYEAYENPHYHKSSDAPNTVDLGYVADVARMVVATVSVVGG